MQNSEFIERLQYLKLPLYILGLLNHSKLSTLSNSMVCVYNSVYIYNDASFINCFAIIWPQLCIDNNKQKKYSQNNWYGSVSRDIWLQIALQAASCFEHSYSMFRNLFCALKLKGYCIKLYELFRFKARHFMIVRLVYQAIWIFITSNQCCSSQNADR